MAKSRTVLPDDLQQLLNLVRNGRLFALQEWIKAGRRLRAPEIEDYRAQVLRVAVETGFHSVVEELLRTGGWDPSELAEALDLAIYNRRSDIAELLLNHRAPLQQLDFETVCRTMDLALMERFLRGGGDPSHENGFARALSSMKARPLLRFYRQFRSEFPELDNQAALALTDAVAQGQVRWTSLLVWAGADPFRSVPWDMQGSFPITEEDGTTAANRFLWQTKPEIWKALNLKPTAAQARTLLERLAYSPNLEVTRAVLKAIPPSEINDTDRGSSTALESLVRHGARTNLWTRTVNETEQENAVKAIELLLDHGARWNPAPNEFGYIRRGLLEHDGQYIVQVLRLLFYTPGAADFDALNELCRSQTLKGKVTVADPQLVREIAVLCKTKPTVLDVGEKAKNETAQEA